MNKIYVVYKHTNKTNNKVYIGVTCREPHRRWGSQGQNYSSNIHFYSAIKKLGWDEFKHEILIHGLTPEQASKWEIKLISFYKSNNPKYGYNRDKGGIKELSFFEDSSKVIIELPNMTLYSSEIECATKLGLTISQVTDMCFDRSNKKLMWLDDFNNFTNEEKNILLYNQKFDYSIFKDKFLNYTNIGGSLSALKIVNLENETIYNSINDCAVALKASRNTISAHCDGTISYNVKRRFMYLDEYEELSEEEKENASCFNNNYYRSIHNKPIIYLLNKSIFTSVSDCCLKNEVTIYKLLNHCRGNIKGCWEREYVYLKDYLKLSIEEREFLIHRVIQSKGLQYVYLVTGNTYLSIQSIREVTGVKQRTLLRHCQNKLKNPLNRLYMYKSDYEKLSKKEKKEWTLRAKESLKKLNRGDGKPKPVINLLTDKIYKNLKECAKDCRRSERTVSDHCNNRFSKDRQVFMFLSDYNKLSQKEKNKLKGRVGVKSLTIEKIIDIYTNKIYKSMRDCYDNVRKSGIGLRAISTSCRNEREICRFMTLYNFNNLSDAEKNRKKQEVTDIVEHPEKYKSNIKGVIELSSGKTFYSLRECSKAVGIEESVISAYCVGKKYRRQRFMYLDKYNLLTFEEKERLKEEELKWVS